MTTACSVLLIVGVWFGACTLSVMYALIYAALGSIKDAITNKIYPIGIYEEVYKEDELDEIMKEMIK